MYYLRMYELMVIDKGHVLTLHYFNQGYRRNYVVPGFLNAVNRYYGDPVWR